MSRVAPCPFCGVAEGRLLFREALVSALWDAFPVSQGHALIIPNRHIAGWSEATETERSALTVSIERVRGLLRDRYSPDGFNVGFNDGEAAGQTVPHLHVHVIPRYRGDVPDPTGGVRHVIPARGNYLRPIGQDSPPPGTGPPRLLAGGVAQPAPAAPAARAGRRGRGRRGGRLRPQERPGSPAGPPPRPARPRASGPPPDGGLSGRDRPGRPRRAARPGGRDRRPRLPGPGAELPPQGVHLPPRGRGRGRLRRQLQPVGVGPGPRRRVELPRAGLAQGEGFREVARAFEGLFRDPATRPLDCAWLEEYRRRRPVSAPDRRHAAPTSRSSRPRPRPCRTRSRPAPWRRWSETRADGERRRARRAGHRPGQDLAGRVRQQPPGVPPGPVRRPPRRDPRPGARHLPPHPAPTPASGTTRATGRTRTPTSCSPRSRPWAAASTWSASPRDAFDYIVVDEFHHAAARTYRSLHRPLPAQVPARPDGDPRADGRRRPAGALRGEPGLSGATSSRASARACSARSSTSASRTRWTTANIPWRSTRFDEEALTERRGDDPARRQLPGAAPQARRPADARLLLSRRATPTSWPTSSAARACARPPSTPAPVGAAGDLAGGPGGRRPRRRLRRGHVQRGRRPAAGRHGDDAAARRSRGSIWLQQLGRGLRQADGKPHLAVIDYIGNHRSFLLKPRTLLQLGPGDATLAAALRLARSGELELPRLLGDLRARRHRPARVPPARRRRRRRPARLLRGLPRAARPAAHGLRAVPRGLQPPLGAAGLRLVAAIRRGHGRPGRRSAGRAGARGGLPRRAGSHPDDQELQGARPAGDARPGRPPGRDRARLPGLGRGRARRPVGPTRAELEVRGDEADGLARLLAENPIRAWTEGRGTGGRSFFRFEAGRFATAFSVPDSLRPDFQDLVTRAGRVAAGRIPAASGAGRGPTGPVHVPGEPRRRPPDPIPARPQAAGGGPRGLDEGLRRRGVEPRNFVKVAVNVVQGPEGQENRLPEILRGWFGAEAGRPGTRHQVEFRPYEDGFAMRPCEPATGDASPRLWGQYRREEIPAPVRPGVQPGRLERGVRRPAGGDLPAGHAREVRTLPPARLSRPVPGRTTCSNGRARTG